MRSFVRVKVHLLQFVHADVHVRLVECIHIDTKLTFDSKYPAALLLILLFLKQASATQMTIITTATSMTTLMPIIM